MAVDERTPACPNCGGEMVRRLDDFECTACGYFTAAQGALTPAQAAGRELIARRIAEAEATEAAEPPPARRSLVDYDPPGRSGGWLSWAKPVFLIVAFLEFSLGTVLVAGLAPAFPVTPAFIVRAVFAGLVLALLAAVVLYVDWPAFRVLAQVVIGLAIIVYGVNFAFVWNSGKQLLLTRMTADVVVLSVLGVLNYLDLVRMRRQT